MPEVVDIGISASPYSSLCRVYCFFRNPVEVIVFKIGDVSGKPMSEGSSKPLETEIEKKTPNTGIRPSLHPTD